MSEGINPNQHTRSSNSRTTPVNNRGNNRRVTGNASPAPRAQHATRPPIPLLHLERISLAPNLAAVAAIPADIVQNAHLEAERLLDHQTAQGQVHAVWLGCLTTAITNAALALHPLTAAEPTQLVDRIRDHNRLFGVLHTLSASPLDTTDEDWVANVRRTMSTLSQDLQGKVGTCLRGASSLQNVQQLLENILPAGHSQQTE